MGSQHLNISVLINFHQDFKMVKNVARTVTEVLIKLQENRENTYIKKDHITIRSAFYFEKLSQE